jgi:hypothetical protein
MLVEPARTVMPARKLKARDRLVIADRVAHQRERPLVDAGRRPRDLARQVRGGWAGAPLLPDRCLALAAAAAAAAVEGEEVWAEVQWVGPLEREHSELAPALRSAGHQASRCLRHAARTAEQVVHERPRLSKAAELAFIVEAEEPTRPRRRGAAADQHEEGEAADVGLRRPDERRRPRRSAVASVRGDRKARVAPRARVPRDPRAQLVERLCLLNVLNCAVGELERARHGGEHLGVVGEQEVGWQLGCGAHARQAALASPVMALNRTAGLPAIADSPAVRSPANATLATVGSPGAPVAVAAAACAACSVDAAAIASSSARAAQRLLAPETGRAARLSCTMLVALAAAGARSKASARPSASAVRQRVRAATTTSSA